MDLTAKRHIRYHLERARHAYKGEPYCGTYTDNKPAAFVTLEGAQFAQEILQRRHPVGWSIYEALTGSRISLGEPAALYHVVKRSRGYRGYAYCGHFSNSKPAEYGTLAGALAAQDRFTNRSHIGWDVYDAVTSELVSKGRGGPPDLTPPKPAPGNGWISVSVEKPPYSKKKDALGTSVLIWPRNPGNNPLSGIDGHCYYGCRATGRPAFYKHGAEIFGVEYFQLMPEGPINQLSGDSDDATA